MSEREPKKLKMNEDNYQSDINLSNKNNGEALVGMDFVPIESSPNATAPLHDRFNVDFSSLPEAESVEQFLENPLLVRPKPEFLTLFFNDDDTMLTQAVKNQVIPLITFVF